MIDLTENQREMLEHLKMLGALWIEPQKRSTAHALVRRGLAKWDEETKDVLRMVDPLVVTVEQLWNRVADLEDTVNRLIDVIDPPEPLPFPPPHPLLVPPDDDELDTSIIDAPAPMDHLVAKALRPADVYGYARIGVAYYDLSRAECPACQTPLNTLTTWGDRLAPMQCEYGICGACATPFRFDREQDSKLVGLTDGEVAALPVEIRSVMDRVRQMLNQ
jgi:hypothetical protein